MGKSFMQEITDLWRIAIDPGNMMNVIRSVRFFEQHGADPELDDAKLMRSMADKFEADWLRWKFDGTYAFPEDMLRASEQPSLQVIPVRVVTLRV
jgi:hypothetical protein